MLVRQWQEIQEMPHRKRHGKGPTEGGRLQDRFVRMNIGGEFTRPQKPRITRGFFMLTRRRGDKNWPICTNSEFLPFS